VILVGNKCDVTPKERVVKEEEGRALAANMGVPYFETSARKNVGVDAAFEGLAKMAAERLIREREARDKAAAGGGGGAGAGAGAGGGGDRGGKAVDIKQPARPGGAGGKAGCGC